MTDFQTSTSSGSKAKGTLDPHLLAQVGALDLRARMAVEGLMSGTHKSPLQGVSSEFAQHRQYVAGDDVRFLDWKVAARTDKLYLKQFFKETNLDLAVMVDVSGSMAYQGGAGPGVKAAPWSKFECASTLAGALAFLAIHQQDRTGLWMFDSTLRQATRMSNNTSHWRSVSQVLQSTRPAVTDKTVSAETPNVPGRTDLSGVFDQVSASLTRRSLVVIISDLFDDPTVLDKGLARLRFRGHDVMLLHVMDEQELTFPYRSASEFVGREGEGRLPVDAAALRKAYLEVVDTHLRAVEETARKFRFDYLLVDTARPLGPALARFLARRDAMIGKR